MLYLKTNMPTVRVFLNDKTDKKVKIFMASRSIPSKGKAIENILEAIDLDYSNILEEEDD